MDRLTYKIRNKKVCVGVLDVLSSPEIAETMASAGLDYICIDQMFTSTDWDRTAHIIRAAKAAGISPMVRVEANPWLAKGDPGKVVVECTRAQGVGASGVMASVASPKELEAIIEASKDWHRAIHVIRFHEDMKQFTQVEKKIAEASIVIPLLESQSTVKEFEEILSVDGLEAVMIGISDMSRVMGYPFQYEHPEVWKMVDAVVNICEKKGIVCGGNTGYTYQDPEAIAGRISRMVDHGLRYIMVQSDGSLFQFFTRNIVRATEKALGQTLSVPA